jgi:hypothetical protein
MPSSVTEESILNLLRTSDEPLGNQAIREAHGFVKGYSREVDATLQKLRKRGDIALVKNKWVLAVRQPCSRCGGTGKEPPADGNIVKLGPEPEACWAWQGTRAERPTVVRRMYEQHTGDRRGHLNVVMTCGNGICVRPAHMQASPAAEPDKDTRPCCPERVWGQKPGTPCPGCGIPAAEPDKEAPDAE